ncbi:MAG TPA: SDR family NAD(P)-dependent oxidoreductase [Dehalococcoidia bacterium]|nr:SDR family NAD(P)-dependent oxidoreductase [Dehalococcoidia bacterium]
MRLENKVAIITGSGGGQGRRAAERFAEEGARVVVTDVKREACDEVVAGIAAGGGEAIAVPADVSRSADVKALVEAALDSFGKLDIMYNNAGILLADRDGPVTELDEDAWDLTLSINLKGIYLGCKYAIPAMQRAGGGSIVNTASTAGLVGVGGSHAYMASKGGVIALTRGIAVTYGRHQIRCNAICPGVVETPMVATLTEHERAAAAALRWHVLRRFGQPDDVVGLALFLASDESGWMTGSIIPIDGGLTAK